jgi:hypothetical protein
MPPMPAASRDTGTGPGTLAGGSGRTALIASLLQSPVPRNTDSPAPNSASKSRIVPVSVTSTR